VDTFLDYLPLVIFLLVFLRLLLRKGKKAQTPAKPMVSSQQVTSGPPAASPFEDLIRRIEKAAEEAARQNTARGQGTPPPRPPAVPPRPAATRPGGAGLTQWRGEGDFVPTERAVNEPTPLERITLERGETLERGVTLERPEEAEFHPIYDLSPAEKALHESHRVVAGPPPSANMPSLDMPGAHLHDPRAAAAARQHPLVAMLKAPGGMRTAFILKEILTDRRRTRR